MIFIILNMQDILFGPAAFVFLHKGLTNIKMFN